MRDIPTLIRLILCEEHDIPELPLSNIVIKPIKGTELEYDLPPTLLIQIARLQTLAYKEMDKSTVPMVVSSDLLAEDDVLSTASGLYEIHDDTMQFVMMINYFIILLVRKQFGAEADRLGVHYYLQENRRLCFVPSNFRFGVMS